MKISVNSAFGAFCEYLRHTNKLSQKTLSEELGINIGTVSKIERGMIDADLLRLHKMSDYFKCTPGFVMTNTWDWIKVNIQNVEIVLDSDQDQFVDFMKYVELKLKIPRPELFERFFTEEDSLILDLSGTYIPGVSLPEIVAEIQLQKEIDKKIKKGTHSPKSKNAATTISSSCIDFGD